MFSPKGVLRSGNPASQPQLKKVIAQLSQRTITLIDQLYGRQIAAIGHAFAKLHTQPARIGSICHSFIFGQFYLPSPKTIFSACEILQRYLFGLLTAALFLV